MNLPELIGYLASLLVLMTFCMSGMVALRALAIASNVAFIAYAALVGISPVLVLHALLLPMNAYRLLQAVRDRVAMEPRSTVPPQTCAECDAYKHAVVKRGPGIRLSDRRRFGITTKSGRDTSAVATPGDQHD